MGKIDTTSTESLIESLLQLSEKDVVTYWAGLNGKDRLSLLIQLSEVKIYTEQTYYQTLDKVVKKPQPLPPIVAFRLANKITTVTSKAGLADYLKKHAIVLSDVKLSDLKPIIENSMHVLMRLYLCSTFEESYSYVEMGKLLKDADITRSKKEIEQLLEAHTNLNLLLSWFRIAAISDYYDYGVMLRRANGEKPEEDPNGYYPPPALIGEMIVTTTDIIDRMRFLPKIIIRSLRESTDLNQFFTVVDSILVNLAHKFQGDEIKIRRRMAFMSIIRDVLDDTVLWRDMMSRIKKV